MAFIIDLILKIIINIVMPLIMKALDLTVGLVKYVLDSNPELKAKLIKWLVATISPKIMDLYLRHQTAKAQKSQKAQAESRRKKTSSQTKTPETEPVTEDQTDDPDLLESASETAGVAYRKARQVTGEAGRRAAGFLAKAREWLEEPAETEEPESPAESDRRTEDDELAALKRKMQADKGTGDRRKSQSPTTRPPASPEQPAAPTPVEPEKSDSTSDQKPAKRKDQAEADERAPGQLPDESFSDYLKRVLEEKKRTQREKTKES